ncbi:NRDE family protein [Frigoribacterium sp. 2-23]|uniref:NRDE family protein n=1 Tax=Frigoribacterium sp. 2-23 TaxID=3415006 RepID=UPI003C6EBA59
MCTVIVSLQPGTDWPVVLLGLRDELADRPWDPPGAWWPELGDRVVGVHDREAGGAWLAGATGPSRLAVVLNRHEQPTAPPGGWTTRGALPLDAVVDGVVPTGPQTSRPFTLLSTDDGTARTTSWDGESTTTTELPAGVHMLTHGRTDDPDVARVARWLPRFRSAPAPTSSLPDASDAGDGEGSWGPWLDVLRESAELPVEHDEAIVKRETLPDGRLFGSLSACMVALSAERVSISHARLLGNGSVADALTRRTTTR